MLISKVQPSFISNYQTNIKKSNDLSVNQSRESLSQRNNKIPVSYTYGANIHFGEFFDPNRTIPHIDYEEYVAMRPNTKKIYRLKYKNFAKDKTINKDELVDKKYQYLPLRDEKTMDSFLEVADMYSEYKNQPIICLGRSPKWFLNAALWMENGINDYKFVAFSKFWYRPDSVEGLKRMDSIAPTPEEEVAYKKYLKRIKADPKSIVDHMRKTGEKTVITDYICSTKGICSFLDIVSRYAEEQGVLEDFAHSIQIVGIGSMEYMENLNPYAEYISQPKVIMPEKLRPYDNIIPQRFYDIKDYKMFEEMLLNQNTNECRSTYYPHEAWTVYKPDQFKTGLITDMKKVKEKIKQLKHGHERCMSSFTPAMFDYRNLLNFRILDAINERKRLKKEHKSKV